MNTELESLKARAEAIAKAQDPWKRCQDGSYELALSINGYFDLLDKIKLLEQQ